MWFSDTVCIYTVHIILSFYCMSSSCLEKTQCKKATSISFEPRPSACGISLTSANWLCSNMRISGLHLILCISHHRSSQHIMSILIRQNLAKLFEQILPHSVQQEQGSAALSLHRLPQSGRAESNPGWSQAVSPDHFPCSSIDIKCGNHFRIYIYICTVKKSVIICYNSTVSFCLAQPWPMAFDEISGCSYKNEES